MDDHADSSAVAGQERADERETLLGRFEMLEEIGAGGFGFVVRARDRLLGREVALKMPLPDRVLAPGDVRRFLREAQAAARLDHPNIVRVYDAGEIGPLGYFIASEFCSGPSLRRWLKAQNEPVPPQAGGALAGRPRRRRPARSRPRHPSPRHQARQRDPGDWQRVIRSARTNRFVGNQHRW